ncbi:transcriptional regulator, TetR family [Paenibacillus uliginis N3/975]|uniref:Transcriptional regulator, TetR family n=1 Tax=Paenibacillus uliginis N3/975 TaxID=1313296 RepID=A0A1X7GH34_9BACL|nr:TetR/AcrR family transcriptional regulator [Paenibacillus uliginis]SMF69761.1 transcriptional regulator, TetR family [Paenibacillus uliginis N3/975]
MKENAVDRRIVRTKKALRDALTALMKEITFDEITVSDLTRRADINRGTFYLHYRDKYDLLEQSEEEIIEGIRSIRSQKQQLTKEDLPTFDYMNEPMPFVTELFAYVKENADFMRVILGPKGNPAFHVKLKTVMRDNMSQGILTHLDEAQLIVPIGYISAYAISAQLGVIQHWLDSGMKESPEELSLINSKLVFGNPATIYKKS